jgi:hypothetical protein
MYTEKKIQLKAMIMEIKVAALEYYLYRAEELGYIRLLGM